MLGNGACGLLNRCLPEVSKISDESPVNNCDHGGPLSEHVGPLSEHGGPLPDVQRDDMLARRIGTFQKCAKVGLPSSTTDNQQNIHNGDLKTQKAKMKESKPLLQDDDQQL